MNQLFIELTPTVIFLSFFLIHNAFCLLWKATENPGVNFQVSSRFEASSLRSKLVLSAAKLVHCCSWEEAGGIFWISVDGPTVFDPCLSPTSSKGVAAASKPPPPCPAPSLEPFPPAIAAMEDRLQVEKHQMEEKRGFDGCLLLNDHPMNLGKCIRGS